MLRVLARITNRSREAMVPMQQPSGYALRAARMKTTCSSGSPGSGPWWLSSWGVRTGEGASPLPAQAGPGARWNRAGELPRRHPEDVLMENLGEMMHQCQVNDKLSQ